MQTIEVLGSFIAISLLSYVASKVFPSSETSTKSDMAHDYQRFNPQAQLSNTIEACDNKAAIIELLAPDNEIGIVSTIGDQLVCRTLTLPNKVTLETNADILNLSFNDFTMPNFQIKLSPDNMKAALKLFEPFTSKNETPSHGQ